MSRADKRVITGDEFTADPSAVIARARVEGPVTILGDDGKPRMVVSSPQDRLPVEDETARRPTAYETGESPEQLVKEVERALGLPFNTAAHKALFRLLELWRAEHAERFRQHKELLQLGADAHQLASWVHAFEEGRLDCEERAIVNRYATEKDNPWK